MTAIANFGRQEELCSEDYQNCWFVWQVKWTYGRSRRAAVHAPAAAVRTAHVACVTAHVLAATWRPHAALSAGSSNTVPAVSALHHNQERQKINLKDTSYYKQKHNKIGKKHKVTVVSNGTPLSLRCNICYSVSILRGPGNVDQRC